MNLLNPIKKSIASFNGKRGKGNHVELIRAHFDSDYYISQLDNPGEIGDPVIHFCETWSNLKFNPHRLFNTAYYLDKSPDVAQIGFNPFLHFLLHGLQENRPFHPLIDFEHYSSFASAVGLELNESLFTHFVKHQRKNIQPHWLFDIGYYREQLSKKAIAEKKSNPAIKSKFEIANDENLLLHYLEFGAALGLSPSRMFSSKFYVEANKIDLPKGLDPLTHYLIEGWKNGYRFHEIFDVEHYAEGAAINHRLINPLLHFLATPKERRKSVLPFFDEVQYLQSNLDIKDHGLCPFQHFVEYGHKENNRKFSKLASQKYVLTTNSALPFTDEPWVIRYVHQDFDKTKQKIVFVGHEASRTGAPLILLTLMKTLERTGLFDQFLILERGGELEYEFSRYAHVLVRGEETHDQLVSYLMTRLGRQSPKTVIANSIESRVFADQFGLRGIPATLLVHELMDVYYDPMAMQESLNGIQHIIFPAEFVRENFLRYLEFPVDKTSVTPQGLLNPVFGTGLNRPELRRQLLKHIGFPEDAFVIMGCGTVDFRKGVDYFVQIARNLLTGVNAPGNVYFMWVGQIASFEFQSIYYWIQYELKKFCIQNKVFFAGAHVNVEDYFAAADVFLLTSRADPFPCVVQEAMAMELPVIAFEYSGGIPDAIRNEIGICVPFGDVDAAKEAILSLHENKKLVHSYQLAGKHLVQTSFRITDYVRRVIDCAGLGGCRDKIVGINDRKNPIKVFFSAPDWEISGVNTQVIHLVRGLNALGFDARILFTRGRFTYYTTERFLPPDVPVTFLQPESNWHKDIWAETKQFLEEQSPCIYFPNYDYVASAICPGLSSRVGVIGIVHSDDAEHYEHVHRLGSYWNRIVAVSDQVANGIENLNSNYMNKTVTIPYGVPLLEACDRERRVVNSDQPIRLVYAGRFVKRQKRIMDYVEMAVELDRRGVPFELTMIGEGEEMPTVKSRLQGLIKKGKVNLTGRRTMDEVRGIMQESDVFLLLSDFEGLPLALLEAMERGCVPICYDIRSGIRMIVQDGHNGFIAPHGNIKVITDLIERLSSDGALLRGMMSQARRSFETSECVDTKMINSYSKIIQAVYVESVNGEFFRPRNFLTINSPLDHILPHPALQAG